MSSEASKRSGEPRLVVVPTPIGNLGDMTMRAIEALKGADLIFSEDTRVTQKLLSALGVEGHGALRRLDDNVMAEHASDVADLVESGRVIAYCSDAGMPGVSDPGAYLVRVFRDRGLPVEVLPGASAAILAYVASAPMSPQFYFGGFLPRKELQRMSALEGLKDLDAALIFYESPKRIVKSLKTIASVFPLRRVTVCRELTKIHEEVVSGDAEEVFQEFAERETTSGIKGECAIVIESPQRLERQQDAAHIEEEAQNVASQMASDGMGAKAVTSTLMKDFGLSKNRAYELFLFARERLNG